MREWRGKKVAILGAARQGIALARYLAVQGATVVLNDNRPSDALHSARQELDLTGEAGEILWVCGGHPLEVLDGIDLLCVSGGVSLDLPLVKEALARHIPLSNDSQIFLEAAPCEVVGITGSAGKTTTTTLVGLMAQESCALYNRCRLGHHDMPLRPSTVRRYHRIWVGGNIGLPLISVVDQMKPEDLAVVELSSFQLEIMDRSPQVAAVLNVTPNHLDRHGTMQAYASAKAHILDFQEESDVAILGRDDPVAWSLRERVKGELFSFGMSPLPAGQAGTYLYEDKIYLRLPGQSDELLMPRSMIQLRGEHNVLNVLAACTIAAAAGLPGQAMCSTVQSFGGVPHRLQFVRTWKGADWYNDSIATAPERSMAAIRSFDEPLILMVGGRDKKLPWDEFAALVYQRVDHLIVFGEAAEIILRAMERTPLTPMPPVAESGDLAGNTVARPTIDHCSGLREAVQAAARRVEPGDVVLLSPGGTSFDEFRDFEERGECFVQWVNELA